MEVLALLAAPVTEIVKCSVDPLIGQIGYLVHYKKNIDDLGNKVVHLGSTRDGVQRRVEAARRNGELIMEEVQLWLAKVDVVEKAAKRLVLAAQMRGVVIKKEIEEWVKIDDTVGNQVTLQLNVEAENVNGCFKGWCCARSGLSKEAKKKIGIIDQLLNERTTFDTVSNPPPPPTIESMPTGHFQAFESTESAMKQVIEALKIETINIVGVYGMGGVGKTTLMKQVAKRVKVDHKLFEEVVIVTVSQNPDIKKIQGEIAEQLGLKLHEKLSESTRAGRLFERMKQDNRILIILDDLWRRLELADVGIPYGDELKGCKVVLTTRRLDVCGTMNTQKEIQVGVLSAQESWHLFQKNAGDVMNSAALREVAWKVVKECGGLPIAIVTLGRALRDKDRLVWDDVAQQLKRSISTDIEDMEAAVFNSIKLSYEYLESQETKNCFLFCCLFPEDHKISMDELWRYVMGEELLGAINTLEEARGRLHRVVDKLISSSLLLKGDQDGYVMMHDIVRDVAISIGSKESNGFVVKAGMGLRQWPKREREKLGQCKRMSLMNNEISELPDQPECSQLLTLLLLNNGFLEKIPDNFFGGMKALATLDLSCTHISSLPPSLSCLANLGTLFLDFCVNLTDISLLGLLKKLEILSLVGCFGIESLPEEIGGLTNLKLLNLSGTDLQTIPPNVISSLSHLEELRMGYSFSEWEIEGMGDGSKASLAEVASLTYLTTLCLHVKNVKCLSKDISNHWENLTKFCICVGNDYEPGKALRSMRLSNTSDPNSNWVKVLLKRTDELRVLNVQNCEKLISILSSDCTELKEVFNLEGLEEEHGAISRVREMCLDHLPNLKVMSVETCPRLRYIFSQSIAQRIQKLEQLLILNCEKMVKIITSEEEEEKVMVEVEDHLQLNLCNLPIMPPPPIFPNLRQLIVSGCLCLKFLLPMRLVRGLLQLEFLAVTDCKEIGEIIVNDDEENGEGEKDKTVLPRLKELYLEYLPKLSRFYQGGLHFDWPYLEDLRLHKCPSLKKLPLGPQSAPRLRDISGNDRWFGQLDWEDQSVKARLQLLFRKIDRDSDDSADDSDRNGY